ncbi:MAG: hypothetical protein V4498_07160, partial [candidate division FCPU426 bacterium]
VTVNIYSALGQGGDIVFQVTDSKKNFSALWYLVTVKYSDNSFCYFDGTTASNTSVWSDDDGATGGINYPPGNWRNGFSSSNATLYVGPGDGTGIDTLTSNPPTNGIYPLVGG